MVKMRRRFDGNALLYYMLLVMVFCSYIIPIYMGIMLTIPVTSTVTAWLLNILVIAVLAVTLKPVWNWCSLECTIWFMPWTTPSLR